MSTPKITMGFDPSLSNFGFAVYREGSGCLLRGRFRTSSKDLYIDRYVELRDSVETLLQVIKPDRIGLEYPVFKDLYSEGMYGLFLYVSEALRKQKKDVVFFSPLQVKAHARNQLNRPAGWKMEKTDMVEASKVHSEKELSRVITPSVLSLHEDEDPLDKLRPEQLVQEWAQNLQWIRQQGGVLQPGSSSNWNHNESDAYWVAVTASRFWDLQDGTLSVQKLTEQETQQFTTIQTPEKGKNAGRVIKSGLLYRENERFFRWSK